MSEKLGMQLEINFEPYNNVNKKLNTLLERLKKANKLDIEVDTKTFEKLETQFNKLKEKIDKNLQLGINTEETNKAIESLDIGLSKLDKKQIKIIDGETQQIIKQVNNSLLETEKIITNLKNGTTTQIITEDYGKAQNNLYQNLNKLQNEEFSIQQKMIGADEQKTTELTKQLSIIQQQTAQARELISNNNLTNQDKELEIQNKRLLLQSDLNIKQNEYNEKQKLETVEMQKQIDLFKQMMSIKMQNLQTKYGSLVDTKVVDEFKSKLESLSVDNFNKGAISNEFKQIEANVKASSGALRIANQDAKSFGETLVSDAAKFGLWMVIGTVIMQPIRAIEEGITSVKELDDMLNDLQMDMMSTSKGAFNNLVTSSRNLSISLGTNIKDIDEMMKVYSNANTSVDEIMKKTGAAAILTNISDMGAKDSVDAIQAIMLQFDQFKNSSDSLSTQANHINDVLASVAQSLNTDFKTGIQNISEAVKVSGEVINEAGMSYEKYSSIVGKVAEVSRLSGSTIGNAMKTIASRIGRANKGDVSAEEVSVIDKAYQSIGINIRNQKGEFEDLDTTLTSLSKVWGTLNNVQRSYIAEQSAGVR